MAFTNWDEREPDGAKRAWLFRENCFAVRIGCPQLVKRDRRDMSPVDQLRRWYTRLIAAAASVRNL